MMYQRHSAPSKAAWKKETLRGGVFHVLRDGAEPIYRFGTEYYGSGKTLEQFYVDGRWVSERPASCEKTADGVRFWSNGRWITVW